MCPLPAVVQFLAVVVLILMISHGAVSQLPRINCEPKEPTVRMDDEVTIQCNLTANYSVATAYELDLEIPNDRLIVALPKSGKVVTLKYNNSENVYNAVFNVTGTFLGRTEVFVKCLQQVPGPVSVDCGEQRIQVTVVRKKRAIDVAFTASVALLVSIIYVNFGCALNWSELKTHLRRPIGPIIGCVGQFVLMPLLSFAIGKVLFPNDMSMQLGMFFTGVSPGGGASNMWTAILGGNINLSITMTTISTFAALLTMPFWLFTLGKTIFDESAIPVPYKEIGTYGAALVIPLFVGYFLQRKLPRVAAYLARMLKCLSAIFMLFIVVFAVVANLYLFQLFSYQIIVAGMCLPWLGYALAWMMAKLLKQPPGDALAIAIETGIQNTGIAIFLLRVTLSQPDSDLTTVVPVAVAIMTPFPLFAMYLYQKVNERFFNKHKTRNKEYANECDPNCNETNVITIT